jgi:hypothetical protein
VAFVDAAVGVRDSKDVAAGPLVFGGAAWRVFAGRDVGVSSPVAVWRKSSRSGGGGGGDNCVEVAFVAEAVGVRDSKNVAAGQLTFGGVAWGAFASRVSR